jgi:hypothetical protein
MDVGKKHTNHKLLKIPHKFQRGFLGNFDQRTVIYQHLNDGYLEIMDDLGGKENLTHIQISMVEKYIFLEFMIRYLEQRIAQNPKKTKLLGRWISAVNRLSGLANILGLERRARPVESNLKIYMKEKKRKI